MTQVYPPPPSLSSFVQVHQSDKQFKFKLTRPYPSNLPYFLVTFLICGIFHPSLFYWSISITLLFLCWLYHYLTHVHTEWFCIYPNLGCALGSTSLISSTNEFFSMKDVQDIILHEVIQQFQCQFYLALIVARPKPIRLVFKTSSLKLDLLQWMLHGTFPFFLKNSEIHSFLQCSFSGSP